MKTLVSALTLAAVVAGFAVSASATPNKTSKAKFDYFAEQARNAS
jgi:hypothetical protein